MYCKHLLSLIKGGKVFIAEVHKFNNNLPYFNKAYQISMMPMQIH